MQIDDLVTFAITNCKTRPYYSKLYKYHCCYHLKFQTISTAWMLTNHNGQTVNRADVTQAIRVRQCIFIR